MNGLLTELTVLCSFFFQAKMGFREGEGLGKYSQGRKDIVETSSQKGRRGLGLTLKGFDQELNVDWRDEPEVTGEGGKDTGKLLAFWTGWL